MKTAIITIIDHPADQDPTELVRILKNDIDERNAILASGWGLESTSLDFLNPKNEEAHDLGWFIVNKILTRLQVLGTFWSRQDADNYAKEPLTDEQWDDVFNSADWQSLSDPDDVDYVALNNALFHAGVQLDEGMVR